MFLHGLPCAFITNISHVEISVASNPRGLLLGCFPFGSPLKERSPSRLSQGLQLRAHEASFWKSHSSIPVSWPEHGNDHELRVEEQFSHR